MNLKTKKIISSLLIAANLAMPANITLAKEESKTHQEVKVFFNDEQIEFDQQPVIVDGRTKVPFRSIFETMGTIVYYRESDNSILGLTRDGDMIYHVVGTNKATINGVEKTYDSVSEIVNGRTLIPIRMVSDLLNAQVVWNDKTKTIEIDKAIISNVYSEKVRGIMGCALDQNFNPEDFDRYVNYQYKNWGMDPKQVIIDVNMDMDRELVLLNDGDKYPSFDYEYYGPRPEDIEIVKNPHDPLVYLNKFNRLPDGFEPTNITNFYDIDYILSKEESRGSESWYKIKYSFLKMKEELVPIIKQMLNENKDNLEKNYCEELSVIRHGYLEVKDIEFDYDLNFNPRDDDPYHRLQFDTFALPYHSEYQTGYAFSYLFGYSPHSSPDTTYFNCMTLGLEPDMYTLRGMYYTNPNNTFLRTYEQFEWLENNAYKYGIIQRYPKGKEHITRYLYQPHVYRYVGKEVAKIMHDNNWCFDEYYARYLVTSEYKTDLESTKKKVLDRY